jgi:hypothetical protein|tara:strand:+ start:545 stop:724 length:180 start_codon:yes stop_codon:yes gene_type:complete
MLKDDIKVAEKLPGIINLMSQNILTNLVKIRHLEARIKIMEQREEHRQSIELENILNEG